MRLAIRNSLGMALVLAALLSIFGLLQAQVAITGGIVGIISDPTGAVVPLADVTLTNQETQLTLTTKSDDAGFYSFTNLPRGTYTVKVQKPGFVAAEISGVTLLVSQQQRVNISLRVGETTQTVVVTAAPSSIEADRTLISTTLTTRQITELPVNRSRDRIGALMMLMPGVQFPFGDEPRLAGTNLYGGVFETVDGGEVISGGPGFPGPGNPNYEAIEELQVVTNSPSAEYAYGSTNVVMISRSGTNAFHGDTFWFNQNRALRARRKYELHKAPYNQNVFGGDFGGPIKKDKLFFFASFEDQIIRDSNSHIWSMPTAAMKRGDFSGFLASGKIITDPSGTPFEGNKIPQSLIDPVAVKLMAFMPDPSQVGPGPAGTGPNLTGVVPDQKNFPRPNFRIDYQPSSNDRIFARFQYYREFWPIEDGGGLPTFGNYSYKYYVRQLPLGWTKVISPRMTSEFHYSYLWFYPWLWEKPNSDFDPTTLFPQLKDEVNWNLTSALKPKPGLLCGGLPNVDFSGAYQTVFDYHCNPTEERNQMVSENITWVKGGHQIKFGGNFWHYANNSGVTDYRGRGGFSFTGRYTGNPFADFLLGDVASSVRGPAYYGAQWRQSRFGFFVEDQWHMSSRLTFNAGLRWDINEPLHEVDHRVSLFDPRSNALVTFNGNDQYPSTSIQRLIQTYPIITSVKAGFGARDTWIDTMYLWGPRLGFAYRPFGDKTVIRAGAGIYHPYQPIGWTGQGVSNPPFSLTENFVAPPGAPAITFKNPFPGTGDIGSHPSIFGEALNWKMESNAQWNLTVEHMLPANIALRVSYVGEKTTHATSYLDLNLPRQNGPAPAGGFQAMRPYQPWSSITWSNNAADSHSNAFQISANRQSGDFTYGFQYQLIKSLNDGVLWDVQNNAYQNPFDLSGEVGNGAWIARQNGSFNWVYNVPFGRGKRFASATSGIVNGLVGGWEVSSVTLFRSGFPKNVYYNSPLVGYPTSVRPDLVGNPVPSDQNPNHWWNIDAFKPPAPYTFGSLGRSQLWGPGLWNVDFSLLKNFPIQEKVRLQFRSEFYNVFNHLNPGGNGSDVNNSLNNPGSFGVITSWGSSRQLNLGLKLLF